MRIDNQTPFAVAALPLMGPEDRPFVTVIVKGTFEIRPDQPALPLAEPIPILYGDEFHPGESSGSVRFESDICPFKPATDIVLVGRAHAPWGEAAPFVDVSLRVGSKRKALRVFGDRIWKLASKLMSARQSEPVPFRTMDLVYERAFGGVDSEGGGVCMENPVGKGYFVKKTKKAVHQAFLPNIEDPDRLITSPTDHPPPAGFGFIGRGWQPRSALLGTYDEAWQAERCPDPPRDFRFEFYNGAHPDLQVEGYLEGHEEVLLTNLTPEGRTRFSLPGIRPRATVAKTVEMRAPPTQDPESTTPPPPPILKQEVPLRLDTLCLIPEEGRFYQVWRGLCPIRKLDSFEVSAIEVRKGV